MSEQVKAKNISRRAFLRAAGLVGSAALVANCAPKPAEVVKPAEGEQEKPAAPAAENITITWWNQFTTPMCQDLFPKIVTQFTDQHSNIKVEFEISGGPPGGGDYLEVINARIAAGNPPDNITLWSPPSQFGARGAMLAIDSYMEKASKAKVGAFYDGPIASCQWRGKTYGLPASAGAGCLFINKAMFEEKGISTRREDFPKTWDGLKQLSAKLMVVTDGEIQRAGFVPWTASWLKPVWSELNGGKIFDGKSIQYKVDSQENIDLLEYWVSYLNDQLGGDIEKLNLIANFGSVYPGSAFALEKAAIEMEGAWGCTDAEIPFDWEIMKFPVGPKGSKSLTGFWPNWWAIPKGTKQPDAAFLLAEHFCTDGWVYWYVEGTMDTPAWKNAPEGIYTKMVESMYGADRAIDLHNFFTDYLVDTAEMWTSPIEDFASDTIGQAIDEVLHKVTPIKDALASAQNTCQAKLEETLKSL
jgi:multiple sugar transport system substrate-binding protein